MGTINRAPRLMTKARYRDFGCFIGSCIIFKFLGANAIRPYTEFQNKSKGISRGFCQQAVGTINRAPTKQLMGIIQD